MLKVSHNNQLIIIRDTATNEKLAECEPQDAADLAAVILATASELDDVVFTLPGNGQVPEE